jgi:hypothetical protein
VVVVVVVVVISAGEEFLCSILDLCGGSSLPPQPPKSAFAMVAQVGQLLFSAIVPPQWRVG